MGQKIPTTVSYNLPDGQEVVIETGKLATQADGSVVVRIGKTMLFCSVVSNPEMREGQSFFPLSVDYQEKFAAAGRIPGNFFRREARLSENEILICRLVDRAIRPLFPDNYMNETQIIINLISADPNVKPDVYAALAASAALTISDIPFAGPISEVRVAKIDGEYKVNPPIDQLENAILDIIVGATKDNVTMVEGECKEVSEEELIEAIKVGHEEIKAQCALQIQLAEKLGATEIREIVLPEENEEIKAAVAEFATEKINAVSTRPTAKHERKKAFSAIKDEMKAHFTEKNGEEHMAEFGHFYSKYFDKLKKTVIREMIMSQKLRLDGRDPKTVRPIWTEVDYLPTAHGSAIFNRGETQALTSCTLGSKIDEMMVDNALGLYKDNFILHYNFPAFSVGEVRPMRGPGRREIGHANLASRSLRQVMPDNYPYTVRLVSDILESNGSSSMATVCAGSLSLMDAGVPLKSPVAGIAMGMVSDGERNIILSDILGDEDALGDMDFKLTGTAKGITACQMDIKIDGLPYDLLNEALHQAKEGRLHILGEMAKTMETAREDYKPHAPRIVEIIIEKEFIGAVIGPGGKIIQEMQKETNTTITIEEVGEKGHVNILSPDKESIDKAVARISDITFQPTVGDSYDAVVATVMPYGVFVDFKGKSGLLHVSEISHSRIEKVEEHFQVGDEVRVKLLDIDKRSGKMKLSRKALIPRPNRENKDK